MKPIAAPSVKLTYEDFLTFPDDGKRHEIIDGEHYVTPSPNTRHQRVSMNLTLALGNEVTAEAGDILTTPLLPDFSVSLSEIFATPS